MHQAKDYLCALPAKVSSQEINVFFLQAKGAFVGAITSSDPMFSLPLELRDTLKLDYDHPMSPYDKRSPVLLEYAQGLKALPVPEKLTVNEASSLMAIWRNEDVLFGGKLFSSFLLRTSNEFEQTCFSANYDEQLLAKYTESGGNARDFVWKGILSSFSSLECPLPEWTPPKSTAFSPLPDEKIKKGTRFGGGQHSR